MKVERMTLVMANVRNEILGVKMCGTATVQVRLQELSIQRLTAGTEESGSMRASGSGVSSSSTSSSSMHCVKTTQY